MRKLKILLVACFELGHQPLSLASPSGFLKDKGFIVTCNDLSVGDLLPSAVAEANLVCISTPMHTALRIGVAAAQKIREINPHAHICFYGLYAQLNAPYLLGEIGPLGRKLADTVLSGEYETGLLQLAQTLEHGREIKGIEGVGSTTHSTKPSRIRQRFVIPDRSGLPHITHYAQYVDNGRSVPAGYVEASRGCLHTCNHCPVVPIYEGRFFVVPAEIVLADIRQQISAGARHITFGDPDFLNGPGHSLKIVKAMHDEFPGITFDFTTKVEHILENRHLISVLRDAGAAFVISAFESTSDHVLKHLNKGHSSADLDEALDILRGVGLPIQTTWVPFTPWTTLDDYLIFLNWIRSKELIGSVPPIQLSIRLLIPPGSWLISEARTSSWLGAMDAENFSYSWQHPDKRMDLLQSEIAAVIEQVAGDNFEAFLEIESLAYEIAGETMPISPDLRLKQRQQPRLSEDWFC